MTSQVSQNPISLQPNQGIASYYERLKKTAEVVVQIAIQIFFIAASILTAAAAFPVRFHSILLPLVGLSTTLYSSLFYLFPNPLSEDALEPHSPLLIAVQADPVVIHPAPQVPPQQLRGLVREGNNCCFNSTFQFINSDPQIANWFRAPFTHEIDLAAFENFLASYQPGQQAIARFREYVDQTPHPRPTIPFMFRMFAEQHSDFLNVVPQRETWFQNQLTETMNLEDFEHFLAPCHPTERLIQGFRAYIAQQPRPGANIPAQFQAFLAQNPYFKQVRKLRETFEAIIALHQFFYSYDNGTADARNGIGLADSQKLRVALHRLDPNINRLSNQQEDAGQVLSSLFSLLPPEQHILIQNEVRRNGELAPLQDPLRNCYLHLDLIENQPVSQLEQMFRNSCDYNPTPDTNIRLTFPEAPNALRFQINRFKWIPPQPTWWSRRFPAFFSDNPGTPGKVSTPIEVPEEITITLRNGEQKRYRLVSFINHQGESANSGHYIAGRIVNENRYIFDDMQVTLVDPAQWQERLRQAYFLSYLPVPD